MSGSNSGGKTRLARQLRDALGRLYDPVFLKSHPLTWLVAPEDDGLARGSIEAGRGLQQWLMAAIENLKPAPSVRADSTLWRGYQLMQLRYVEALDAPDVQQRLGIAKSQYYREHERALSLLAELLDEACQRAARAAPAVRPADAEILASGSAEAQLPLTRLIGRERELSQVASLLPQSRLLTFTGPGGVGKTRLALELGRRLAEAGQRLSFVTLAGVADRQLVLPTLARSLGLRDDEPQAILSRLQAALYEPRVLIIDNFEQVADAAEDILRLVQSCPALRVVITSRQRLGVDGEQEFYVAPLPVAEAEAAGETCDAVRLFVERAAAVRRSFDAQVDPATVLEICRRVEGLPLAIVLAAARMRSMTPRELLERLDSQLSVLTAGPQDWSERHRRLETSIGWSYWLLNGAEQAAFRQLSIFAGGCTLEAAEAVIGGGAIEPPEVVDLIDQLVAKSMVTIEARGGRTRYRLLEPLRQYGAQQLAEAGEDTSCRDRHARFYLELAEQADEHLVSADQQTWWEYLELEHDNARAALNWLAAPEPALRDGGLELRLAAALGWFWYVRGYWDEGRHTLERALAATHDSAIAPAAKALARLAFFAWAQNDYAAAVPFAQRALGVASEAADHVDAAFALTAHALVAMFSRQEAAAEALLNQSLEHCTEARFDWGIGICRLLMGHNCLRQGRMEEEQSLREAGLAMLRRLGERWGIALGLYQCGIAAVARGSLSEAAGLFEESMRFYAEMGSRGQNADCIFELGMVQLRLGNLSRSEELFRTSLGIRRDVGSRSGVAACLTGLARVGELSGGARDAVLLLAASEQGWQAAGIPRSPQEEALFQECLAAAKAALPVSEFAVMWQKGVAMSSQAAIEFAMAKAQSGAPR